MLKQIIFNKSNLLTFLGLIFCVVGIQMCFLNKNNIAIILLIMAGICDAFDGLVAKKLNKVDSGYGVELDSLADIVCSGIFPVIIGISMGYNNVLSIVVYSVFIICGITRLAFFNINSSKEQYFSGVPITSSTILIPLEYILFRNQYTYTILIAILSILFVSNVKIKKPNLKSKVILSLVGIILILGILLKTFL